LNESSIFRESYVWSYKIRKKENLWRNNSGERKDDKRNKMKATILYLPKMYSRGVRVLKAIQKKTCEGHVIILDICEH
jgi:hypothetical protein